MHTAETAHLLQVITDVPKSPIAGSDTSMQQALYAVPGGSGKAAHPFWSSSTGVMQRGTAVEGASQKPKAGCNAAGGSSGVGTVV